MSIATDLELVPASFNDPRVPWYEKAQQLVHAHNVLGTKREPLTIDGYQYHPDSCGIEYATPPCDTADDFVDSIQYGKRQLESMLGYELDAMHNDRLDCRQLLDAIAVIDRRVLRAIVRIGCDPDYHYDSPDPRNAPGRVKSSTVRELGGHLHIDTAMPPDLAAYTLATQVLPEFHTKDLSGSWYRTPGTYRPKPYGLEYRSLGASWAVQPTVAREIFGRVAPLSNV